MKNYVLHCNHKVSYPSITLRDKFVELLDKNKDTTDYVLRCEHNIDYPEMSILERLFQ